MEPSNNAGAVMNGSDYLELEKMAKPRLTFVTTPAGHDITFQAPQIDRSLTVHELEIQMFGKDDFPSTDAPTVVVYNLTSTNRNVDISENDSTPDLYRKSVNKYQFTDVSGIRENFQPIDRIENPEMGLLARSQKFILTAAGVSLANSWRAIFAFPRDISWQARIRLLRVRWRQIMLTTFGSLALDYIQPQISPRVMRAYQVPTNHTIDIYHNPRVVVSDSPPTSDEQEWVVV